MTHCTSGNWCDHRRAEFIDLARVGHAGGVGQREFGDAEFDEAGDGVSHLFERDAALERAAEGGVEMAPERVMPFLAANSAQSAKPSIILTGAAC